jgi:hypothetical protein
MPTSISKKKLRELLLQGGFTPQEVPMMLEIARRESSMNPLALNPNADTGDLSYGLFQINMIGGMGPERRQALGLKSNEELYDPATNVRAAKYVYDIQGPQAWSVYNPKDPAFNNLNLDESAKPNEPVKQGDTTVEAQKETPKNPFEQFMLGQLSRNTNPTSTSGHPFQQMLNSIQRQGNQLVDNLVRQYQNFGGLR